MKKTLTIILSIFILIFFTGCVSNTINNRDSGKVKSYEYTNKYNDNTYYVFGSFFDNDNKVPYLILTVKNNLISKIKFDYIYKNSSLYFDKKDNEMEEFFINNINLKVIQNQKAVKNTTNQYTSIYNVYNQLLNEAITLACDTGKNLSYVSIDSTYSEVYSNYNADGYKQMLKVTYKNDLISDIVFMQVDENNISINKDKILLDKFKNKYGIEYSSYITSMVAKSNGKSMVLKSDNDLAVDKIYNILAKKINKKRAVFNYKDYSLFKNIK